MSYIALAVGGAGVISGGIQALVGGHKQNQALKGLEGLQTPTTTNNKAIGDYYQEALNRYGVSPYQSNLYNMQKQNAERTTATALNSLQSRGGAMGSIGKIVGAQNDALLRAGTAAEQQQNQRFGQLGSAANMKANDDKYVFGINKMLPYQKMAQLYSLKAGAGGQQLNAGLQGINNGINSAGEIATSENMYGTPKPPKGNSSLTTGLYDNYQPRRDAGKFYSTERGY